MTLNERPAGGRSGWKQDPAGVRKNIIAVAMTEFAANGLSGARIDEIAAKTHTSKRMIYYYFGDKEGLYGRVLEEAYRQVRTGEQELELDHLPPVEALKRLAEFTFDHHSRHPDFIRIVMIENIHHGAYLEQSELIRLLERGGDPEAGSDLPPRARSRSVPRRGFSARAALAHQRVELLQRLEPRHLFAHLRQHVVHRRRAALAAEIIWSKWSSASRSNRSARRDARAYDAPRLDRRADPSIGASRWSAPWRPTTAGRLWRCAAERFQQRRVGLKLDAAALSSCGGITTCSSHRG